MPLFIYFVPTDLQDIDWFFELAPLTSSDVVYDLGSGDGRLLFAALARGAGRAVGIELNHLLVESARREAESRNLSPQITFQEADILDVDLSEATVVFCYLFTTASSFLQPKFEAELKPGARVVVQAFPLPGWKPVRTTPAGTRRFYLYVMPPQKTHEGNLIST